MVSRLCWAWFVVSICQLRLHAEASFQLILCTLLAAPLRGTPVVAMFMCDHAGTASRSSARRRRERRMRAALRHERPSVAMHLAQALHPSSSEPHVLGLRPCFVVSQVVENVVAVPKFHSGGLLSGTEELQKVISLVLLDFALLLGVGTCGHLSMMMMMRCCSRNNSLVFRILSGEWLLKVVVSSVSPVTEAFGLSHLSCARGQPCRRLNSLGALLSGAGTVSSACSFDTSGRLCGWSWQKRSTTRPTRWSRAQPYGNRTTPRPRWGSDQSRSSMCLCWTSWCQAACRLRRRSRCLWSPSWRTTRPPSTARRSTS